MTGSRTGGRGHDGSAAEPPSASPITSTPSIPHGGCSASLWPSRWGPVNRRRGADFRRLATEHTFGHSWSRGGLDAHSRALASVTIAATLGSQSTLRRVAPDKPHPSGSEECGADPDAGVTPKNRTPEPTRPAPN